MRGLDTRMLSRYLVARLEVGGAESGLTASGDGESRDSRGGLGRGIKGQRATPFSSGRSIILLPP